MGRKPFVRERILHAAFDRFARQGYEAVSTREIASAAAVGHASMYKHFPSKEALGRAVYEVSQEPLLAAFDAVAAARPSPAVAVDDALRLLYEAYDQRPRALALLVFPPHEFVPWELDPENPRAVRERLRSLTGSDDDRAAILWGAICGPIQDRFLQRRRGRMAPHAAAHARLVRALVADAC